MVGVPANGRACDLKAFRLLRNPTHRKVRDVWGKQGLNVKKTSPPQNIEELFFPDISFYRTLIVSVTRRQHPGQGVIDQIVSVPMSHAHAWPLAGFWNSGPKPNW